MAVSVIIPTYNRARLLSNALMSVIKQTYRDREIIIIDDGSTDNTYELNKTIIEKYKFIRYFRNPYNEGVSRARNIGIAMSKAKYIAFLDSDDEWRKRKLEKQISAMDNTGYKISYTNERWIKNGNFINQGKLHSKFSGDIFSSALKLCMVSPSSVIVERSVFDKIGMFDTQLLIAEDYDLFIRASIYYDFLFIDDPLVIKHGGHEGQLSKSQRIIDVFRIKSLEKIHNQSELNMILDPLRLSLLKKEIARKANIIANGAFKRENNMFGLYYLLKAIKYAIKS